MLAESKAVRLNKLIEKGQLVLTTHVPNPPNFIGFSTLDAGRSAEWAAQSVNALQAIFGKQSAYVEDFPKRAKAGYTSDVEAGIGILKAAVEDVVVNYASGEDNSTGLKRIARICDRFHLVARTLACRQRSRQAFLIQDEYDVQDILHALFRLDFDDVRPEEYGPSYAGKASRMDFLLKEECAVVEAKYVGKKLSAAEIGNQLIEDIARYRTHPNCRTLICFVFDPFATINNPRGLEKDLSRTDGDLTVVVFIRPG